MTDPYRAMCAELTDAELANAARKSLDSYRYATELPYFLREDSNEYEPLMLAIRAAIAADRARWGHPTPQPVAVAPYREVADLVVWLEDHSAECLELDQPEWSKSINQAARFLHLYLRATPQPVAVSERWPRAKDCDEQGRCWWHRYTPTKEWHLQRVYIGQYNYWLPANALPTPEATVYD